MKYFYKKLYSYLQVIFGQPTWQGCGGVSLKEGRQTQFEVNMSSDGDYGNRGLRQDLVAILY